MGREWMKKLKESGSLFRKRERRWRGQAEERRYMGWMRKGILAECLLLTLLATAVLYREGASASRESAASPHGGTDGNVLFIEDDYIKWVDFTVSYEALCKAYEWDVETHGTEHQVNWVELLAYTAAKTGGEFGKDAIKTMDKAAGKLSEGEITMEELTGDLKYYDYYKEAYEAAIGGLVGEYWEEGPDVGGGKEEGAVVGNKGAGEGQTLMDGFEEEENTADAERAGYTKKYGLKGYFPLARGFDYTHYDDFGAGRSYGYKRRHLGSYVIIVSS